MDFYEIRALMNYEYYAHKEEWEQARLISFLIAQTNSRKKLKLTDIIKFNWESEEAKSSALTEMKNEDLDRLRKKAQNYLLNDMK